MTDMVFRLYSDWINGLFGRFRERRLLRSIRLGRITEDMAQLDRDLFNEMKVILPGLIGILFATTVLLTGFLTRLIPYSPNWIIPLMIILLPLALWQLTISIRYAKPAKRLRRGAILDGHLRPRFPDRIWAWRRGRVIVGGAG